jgi:hypothetical protein
MGIANRRDFSTGSFAPGRRFSLLVASEGINIFEVEDQRSVFILDPRTFSGTNHVSHVSGHLGKLNEILDTKLLLRWFISRNLALYRKTSKANEDD